MLQLELSAARGSGAKFTRFLRITRIFATELIGMLTIAPYGMLPLRSGLSVMRKHLRPEHKISAKDIGNCFSS